MAIGTGNLPYPMSPVSPFDVITSQAENERIANIESLADGTGIGDNAITASKVDFATFSQSISYVTQTTTDRTKTGAIASAIPSTKARSFTSKTGRVKVTVQAHVKVSGETGSVGIFKSDTSTYTQIIATNLTAFDAIMGIAIFTVAAGTPITYTPYFASQSGASTISIGSYTNLQFVIEDILN